ncbi:ArsR/SmtB family transcription factor [Microbacterium oleivorans]|uniref:Winged helix-turn-helix transcriptional regulator n=1 Tax=Microbacterium oleivorans TaxID=273677 RepID=A0A7D5IRF3_9MICO|nr:metalloregulator ArsR/SmtB family transcription factor [Microbacterium oleivorans]QLD12779.1 winged helix-turn-helix transcriptional regulator [Microbacterium oleivorans]
MDADSVFEALASPVRRDILAFLADNGECNAGAIADQISHVARTSVSTHLRILRGAGLVRERRDGRQRLYSLDREGSATLAVGFFQTLMANSLEQVEERLEKTVTSSSASVTPPLRDAS